MRCLVVYLLSPASKVSFSPDLKSLSRYRSNPSWTGRITIPFQRIGKRVECSTTSVPLINSTPNRIPGSFTLAGWAKRNTRRLRIAKSHLDSADHSITPNEAQATDSTRDKLRKERKNNRGETSIGNFAWEDSALAVDPFFSLLTLAAHLRTRT